ncbi:unnamed protein product, partial [Prorocentrum cordatum]
DLHVVRRGRRRVLPQDAGPVRRPAARHPREQHRHPVEWHGVVHMVPGAGPAAEGHEGQRGRADAAGEPRALLFEPRLRVPPARARLGRGGAPRRRAAPLGGAEPQGQDTQGPSTPS